MQLDSYIHTHFGTNSNVDLQQYYTGLHLVNVHSIYFHNNFLNISAQNLNNNIFYYNPTNFIVIPDGAYDLNSFNKYLVSVVATSLY